MKIPPKTVKKVFERDRYQCQYCGRVYAPEQHPLHCHHRIFVAQGGKNDLDNLASCCFECHFEHGLLKNKKLMFEQDDTKINELTQRYRRQTNA